MGGIMTKIKKIAENVVPLFSEPLKIELNVSASKEEEIKYGLSQIGVEFDGSLENALRIGEIVNFESEVPQKDEQWEKVLIVSNLKDGFLIPLKKENEIVSWQYRLGLEDKDLIEKLFNILVDEWKLSSIRKKDKTIIINDLVDIYKLGEFLNWQFSSKRKYSWQEFKEWSLQQQFTAKTL